MCGIFCVILHKSSADIANTTLDGLSRTQNRGYDSSGICVKTSEKLAVYKKINNGDMPVDRLKALNITDRGKISISHTRWATHGKINHVNTHPHLDESHNFSLVHNGIISNTETLKKYLAAEGIYPTSQTDSEFIVLLVSHFYDKGNTIAESICLCNKMLIGNWAYALISTHSDRIFLSCYDKSLIISRDVVGNIYISSEIDAVMDCKLYIAVSENMSVSHENIDELFDTNENKTPHKIEVYTKNKYNTFMEKEIHDQINCLPAVAVMQSVNLDKFDQIIFIGCGSSYHACLMGEALFKQNTGKHISCFDASNFYEYDIKTAGKNTVVILVSQSGETHDLFIALKKIKKRGIRTIAITNSEGSLIARNVDKSIYLNLGKEVSVASTKSFTACATIFYNILFSGTNTYETIVDNFARHIHRAVMQPIDLDFAEISSYKNIFILGTGVFLPTAYESALKIKEISYINAQGYISGGLKHGPFSIIDDTSLTIAFMNLENREAILGTASEITVRGGNVILFTQLKVDNLNYNYVDVPDADDIYLNAIICSIIMQRFAVYTASKLNRNIDFPRNLAKCVTVE